MATARYYVCDDSQHNLDRLRQRLEVSFPHPSNLHDQMNARAIPFDPQAETDSEFTHINLICDDIDHPISLELVKASLYNESTVREWFYQPVTGVISAFVRGNDGRQHRMVIYGDNRVSCLLFSQVLASR